MDNFPLICSAWQSKAELTAPIVSSEILCKWVEDIKKYDGMCAFLVMTNYKNYLYACKELADFSHVMVLYYMPHPSINKGAMVVNINDHMKHTDYHLFQLLVQACILIGDWDACDFYLNATADPAFEVPFICVNKSLLPSLLTYQLDLWQNGWNIDANAMANGAMAVFPFDNPTEEEMKMISDTLNKFAETNEELGSFYLKGWNEANLLE